MMHTFRALVLPALLLLAACGDPGGRQAASTPAPQTPDAWPALDRSADVAGPDADHDGIRDDIGAWIAGQGLDAPRAAAMRQLARSYQAALLADTSRPGAVQDAAWNNIRAIACLQRRSASPADATTARKALRQFTANTRPRVQAYLAYARALDGSVLGVPNGDTCEP